MSSLEVFTDMENEAYHAKKSHVSRSQASRYRGVYGGRAQRFAEVEGKSLFAGNAATGFGTLVDGAFEAEARGIDWRSRCAVPPQGVLASDGSRRGKAFQEWRASLPAGAVECSIADFAKVEDIIASIREHKIARRLLDATQHTQYSVFWTDADGHQRKARADGTTPDEWFDLKTTSSEWRELKWSFSRYAYDWQAAWYCDAAVAAGWMPFSMRFVVVQTFPPYDVKVVRLGGATLATARLEIQRTLDEMRRRVLTGNFVDDRYHEEEVLDLA